MINLPMELHPITVSWNIAKFILGVSDNLLKNQMLHEFISPENDEPTFWTLEEAKKCFFTLGEIVNYANKMGEQNYDPETIKIRICEAIEKCGPEFLSYLPDAWRKEGFKEQTKSEPSDIKEEARRIIEDSAKGKSDTCIHEEPSEIEKKARRVIEGSADVKGRYPSKSDAEIYEMHTRDPDKWTIMKLTEEFGGDKTESIHTRKSRIVRALAKYKKNLPPDA